MGIKNATLFLLLLGAAVPLFAQNQVTLPNGMVINRSTITVSEDGLRSYGKLAKSWVDLETGLAMNFGTEVGFYEKTGRICSVTPAKNWTIPGTTFVAQQGSAVLFHENGDVSTFVSAINWSHPETKITLKKSTFVSLYEGMKFRWLTPYKDIPLWDKFVAAKGAEFGIHGNGTPYFFTLAEGFTGDTGFVFLAGMVISMNDKWNFEEIKLYPKKDTLWYQGGPIFKKGSCATWDGNGRLVSATFAEDWTDPVAQKLYAKDTFHVF